MLKMEKMSTKMSMVNSETDSQIIFWQLSLPECKLCRCYQGLCHDDMEEIKDDDNVKEMNDTNVTFKNHDHVNVENKMLLMTMMKMMERTISKINLSEQKFPSFLSFSVYYLGMHTENMRAGKNIYATTSFI